MREVLGKATIGPGDNGANAPAQDYKAQTPPAFTPEQLANGREWVDALRSGKYPQGKEWLRTGVRFCCLGVACDLFDHEAWISPAHGRGYVFMGKDRALPQRVYEWLGLPDSNPFINHRGNSKAIAHVNDDGASFSEIADLIEQHIYLGMLPASEEAGGSGYSGFLSSEEQATNKETK